MPVMTKCRSSTRFAPGTRHAIWKIYVDNVVVKIAAQRVEYLDEYGKLVTQSLRDFTKTDCEPFCGA